MISANSMIVSGAGRAWQDIAYQVSHSGPYSADWILLLCVLCVVCGLVGVAAAIFVPWLRRRDARAKQRLDLLAASLEGPEVDAQARSQVLLTLTREAEMSASARSSFWTRLMFGFGWLLFVFSLGVTLVMWWANDRESENAFLFALGGLAILSLPIALRELGMRKPRSSANVDRMDSAG